MAAVHPSPQSGFLRSREFEGEAVFLLRLGLSFPNIVGANGPFDLRTGRQLGGHGPAAKTSASSLLGTVVQATKTSSVVGLAAILEVLFRDDAD
jgi:hypothetical protein